MDISSVSRTPAPATRPGLPAAAKPAAGTAAQPLGGDSWVRTSGNRITPLIDQSQVVPAVMDTIRNAQSSIQLSSYLFGGKVTQDIVEALVERKNAGVSVQVLLDPKLKIVGADDNGKAIQYLKDHGVEVRTYPVDQLNPGVSRLRRGNAIDHAKMVVADGKVAIAGGMNLSTLGVQAHDFMAKVQGPGATSLARLFNDDWKLSGGTPLDVRTAAAVGKSGMALAENSPTVHDIPQMVTSQFDAAQKSIEVEALFLDRPDYIHSLIAAHDRGVDVRVLLDKTAIKRAADDNGFGVLVDPLPVDTIPNLPAIDDLRKAGIPVHLYDPHDGLTYLHGKLAMIDGQQTLLGSANFTAQATMRNHEILMDLSDRHTAQTFEHGFNDDWQHHSQNVQQLPWWQRRIAPIVGSVNNWYHGL